MKFASAISTSSDAIAAIDEVIQTTHQQVSSDSGDLLLYFVTPHFEDELDEVVAKLTEAYPRASLIGCTAESVIGADRDDRGCRGAGAVL